MRTRWTAPGFPTSTVAGKGFYERPEIREYANALQAIADPHDDLALVGLLRSPRPVAFRIESLSTRQAAGSFTGKWPFPVAMVAFSGNGD